MLKETVQFMYGVSLGRDRYIADIESANDWRLPALASGVTLVLLALVSVLTHLVKISFLAEHIPELSIGFDSFLALLFVVVFFGLLLIFTLLFSAVVHFFKVQPKILPTFTALSFTSPHYILLSLLPALFYLVGTSSWGILLISLLPIVIFLHWLRVLFLIVRDMYGLPNKETTIAIAATLLFFVVVLLMLWIIAPMGVS